MSEESRATGVKRDRDLKQGTRHKVNGDGEALCRTYGQGWVVPDVASRAHSWNKVTCKACLKKKPMKESFTLTESIKDEVEQVELLLENCKATPYAPKLLVEAADKFIGHAIAALKAGKNPFETIPGSREILAGLMLLAKPTNRESLNMNQKKFDLVSQFIDEKEAVKKYVANLAQQHGQSLVKALDAYVQEKDKREVLTKKLVQLQSAYSKVKHKVGQVQEPVKKRIAV